MKTEIKWAVVLGVLTLLWNVLEKISGFNNEFIEYHMTVGWFYLIPFSLIYFFALTQIKNQKGGLSFGEGIKHSFIIALFSLPLILLASYIKIKYLSPDFLSNMSDLMLTQGADEGKVMSGMTVSGFLMKTAVYPFFGVVVGAIISFFIKDK